MALPFAIPNKLVFSTILGVLLYALFEYSFLPETRLIIKTGLHTKEHDYFIYVFTSTYLLSLVLAIMPAYSSSFSFLLPWEYLDSLSLAKLLASILLTSFLPGYALFSTLVESSRKRSFSKAGVGVLSVLLSFAITSLITFCHWTANKGFGSLNYTLFLSYTMFLIIFSVSSFLRRKRIEKRKALNIAVSSAALYKTLVLLSVGTYLTWVFFSTHSAPQTMHLLHDEFDHVGLTVRLLKGWQPWQSAQTGSGIYPYFLHLVLIAATSISDAPIINVYLSFFFVLILPAFAFYFMAQMISGRERDTPLFATVIFSVFSGFGWIYAVFLQNSVIGMTEVSTIIQASRRTYDIIYSTWLPIYIAPYTVDLAIFFVLIGLAGYKQLNAKTLCILTVVLVTLSAFVHVEKMTILALLLFILSILYIFNVARSMYHLKTVLFSYIIGLLMFFALDCLAPYRITLSYSSALSKGFLISTVGLILIGIGEKVQTKIRACAHVLRSSLKINKRRLRWVFAYFALSVYIVLFVAFFYSFSSYNFDKGSIPLWFFPLKFGVVGLLSLFGLFYIVQDRSGINFFVTLCVGTVLMELSLYHLPFSPLSVDFDEFRVFRDVLWAFSSIVAAYGMQRLLRIFKVDLHLDKRLLKYSVAFLLFFVIFAGSVSSHLLKVQYFASAQQFISSEEMDALNYLNALEIPSGSFILTSFSRDKVYAVTGTRAISLYDYVFAPLVFNSKSPSTNLWILHYLNISYIYMNTEDLQFLQNRYADSFFIWLLPRLPLLFSNDATAIYMVPPISPPLDTSNITVVTGGLLTCGTALLKNSIWMDGKFAEGWGEDIVNNVEHWNFTSDGDVAILEAKTKREQQASVFYSNDFAEYVTTCDNTVAIIKFKSNTAVSYVISDILYSDGSTQRMRLEGNTYMNSLGWATVANFLQPHKSVKTIRVGITDKQEGNGETISVSFDYVGIFKAGKLRDYYIPPLLAALMQINYTTTSEFDPSLTDYDAIFIPDLDFNDTITSKYISWVENGGDLIVIGCERRGTFSDFLAIKESDKYLSADLIVDDKGSSTEIPNISVPELQISDASTTIIANYESKSGSTSPFALLRKLEEGKIMYLEMAPILMNLGGSQDFIKTMGWTTDLLQSYVRLSFFNSSAYGRTFYVKNIGEISLQGETCVETSNMFFCLETLNGVTLSFSNSTSVENVESFFENFTVSKVEFNGVIPVTTIVDGNVTLSPLDLNNYVKLEFDGRAVFEFDVSRNSEVKVDLRSSQSNYTNLLFHDGVLLLNVPHAEDIELVAGNPVITSNGTTTFDSLFASYPYRFQASGNRGTFNGCMELKVRLSEERVLLFDEVQLDGNLHLDVTTASTFSDDLAFFVNFPNESASFTLVIFLFIIFSAYIRIRQVKAKEEKDINE
jgi:hypothetical protein